MDDRAMQRWGVIVGGACAAGALAAGLFGAGEIGPARIAAPMNAVAPANYEAPARAPHLSFVVRFESTHPMARAQALEARGRHDAAVAAARRALQSERALTGLCFNRFTAGGYEIVLECCAPTPAPERATVSRNWMARLRAMNGVEYADANLIAEPEGNP